MQKQIQNLQQSKKRRTGQVLVEFAMIAFVMTLLLSAVIAFGFLFFSANVLQQAADTGAMELSRHSYAATGKFNAALEDSGLFDEAALVVPVGTDSSTLPLINRLLFSLYIYDPDVGTDGVLRYPGALVTNSDGDQTVVIPMVGNRAPITGVEEITEWRNVVEEIISTNAPEGPYALDSGVPDPGRVALRINYPYQAASLVAYTYRDSANQPISQLQALGTEGVQNYAVIADDGDVTGANAAKFPNGLTLSGAGYTLVDLDPDPVEERVDYGFGELQAYATTVRPYRKVLSSQGIYRRELFE